MYSIRLEKVTFIRNNRKILNDISVSFPSGKTSSIIGPSGCGKSTLLKVAAGLIPPTSGKVYVDGKNLLTLNKKDLTDFRKHSGFIFQDAALWANKSVYENLDLPLRVNSPEIKVTNREMRILKILKDTGYTDSIHLRPAQLSNGERKMVSFARALVTGPNLVYMDNPVILVDPGASEKMQKLLLELHQSDKTILANFASIRITKQLTNFAVVMKEGKVLTTGTLGELEKSNNEEVRTTLEAIIPFDTKENLN